MKREKLPCVFAGRSRKDLIAFPPKAKQRAGYLLDMLQNGEKPDGKDTIKVMKGIGQGVFEIRIREGKDAFRIIYTAKFFNKLYVLHCFQKKDETFDKDTDIARENYNSIRNTHSIPKK